MKKEKAITYDELVEILRKRYPHARLGVIKAALECLELHSDKNNDYNGDDELFRQLGVQGRFADVWRKTIRLLQSVFLRRTMLTPEKNIETAQDLVVYSLMLVEELENGTR